MKKFEQDYKYLYKQKVEEIESIEKELLHRNKILRRALQLACAEITGEIDFCCYKDSDCDKTVLTCDECMREYFIDQAKKEMEE